MSADLNPDQGESTFRFDRAWVWRRRDDGETGVRFTDPANDGVMAGFASEYVEVVPVGGGQVDERRWTITANAMDTPGVSYPPVLSGSHVARGESVDVVPASERDRLREAEKLALQLKDEAERCVKDLLAENDRLVGEVERLREALREIAEAEGFERTDASDENGERG